jgi:hypothetical protein
MSIPFKIYAQAVGIYALLTMPALIFPFMYVISLFYVLLFGWFAGGIFTICYFFSDRIGLPYRTRMAMLSLSVPLAVAFSYQMLQVILIKENVWTAGFFLLFPAAAVIAGWISLFVEGKAVKKDTSNHSKSFTEHIDAV